MPYDITTLDLAAFGWFLALWLVYNLAQGYLIRQPVGLNQHMRLLRQAWMERMVDREPRVLDSILVGHLISSVSFFASTTMLILAGLVGLFGGVDHAHAVITELSFMVKTTKPLFELKLLLLLTIFVYAFWKFTWALRQYNYCCALIGAAPLPPVAAEQQADLAASAGSVLSEAVSSFNAGLRAYYFALAALTWFIQPWLFILASAWVLAVLLLRQMHSKTARAVRDQTRALSAPERR